MRTKGKSEYQSRYKPWPQQPVRKILKPSNTNVIKDNARMEKQSVYGIDYGCPKKQRRRPTRPVALRHKPQLPRPKDSLDDQTTYKLEYIAKTIDFIKANNPGAFKGQLTTTEHPFIGDSIYTVSYPAYDEKTYTSCQQRTIKAKDNAIMPLNKSDSKPKSTAQKDFIHHENFERPTPIKAKENNVRPTDPIQSSTEYSDYYTDKMKYGREDKTHHGCRSRSRSRRGVPRKSKAKVESKQNAAVSTAMADYRMPEGFEQLKPFRPNHASNHFLSAPFDGRTTFNMAYKQWPVERQEMPSWNKRPAYKRPSGGFLVNSLYMHDYRDPQMVTKPARCFAQNVNTNFMQNKLGHTKFESTTTYNKEFQAWQNTELPKSYNIMEVYKPPSEKMDCETIQQGSFKGEPSDKMLPCRHMSEHRKLNNNSKMTFVTTYEENYLPPRPLSCPSAGRSSMAPSKTRIKSATLKNGDQFYPIPKPDMELRPYNWSKTSSSTSAREIPVNKANPIPQV